MANSKGPDNPHPASKQPAARIVLARDPELLLWRAYELILSWPAPSDAAAPESGADAESDEAGERAGEAEDGE